MRAIPQTTRARAEALLREKAKQSYIAALLGVSEGWVSEFKKSLGLRHGEQGAK